MPRHEDDDFDVIEGLSADRGDDSDEGILTTTQTSTGAPKPPVDYAQPIEKEASKPDSGGQVSAAKRGVGWLTGLSLIGLFAVCGWLSLQVIQLQQQLGVASNALESSQSQMDTITAQVSETGSSFAETGNVLENKIKFFDLEIRKLWDVSNKRNKNDIAENAKQIESLMAGVQKTQRETDALQTRIKQQDSSNSTVSQSLQKLDTRLAAENTALRATVEDQTEQLAMLRSELKQLDNRFKNMPTDLALRVASNEEAVAAFDTSRLQLMSSLSQLQQRVNELSQTRAP